MKSLAVRVLGDFGVDGIEPQAFGSRKARLALQLIALGAGQAVPAGVLIDALWDTAPPARPEDQLAVLMSRLRSVLGRDRIEHRDQGYLLHCDWLDATELAVLTREVEARREAGHVMGAVAAARVALSLIRGDGPQPLPGEWAQLRQAELERLIGRARLVAATALLEAGDWMAAADAAAAAAERDPYDEAALRAAAPGPRDGRPGGRGAVPVRRAPASGWPTSWAPTLARDDRAVHRDPARRADRARAGAAAPAAVPAWSAGTTNWPAWRRSRRGPAAAAEVVVVDGEAGIGKTTLLRAWAGPARRGRGHGADRVVRAARPLDAARRAADRAGRPAARARARGGRRHPRRATRRCWRRC